MSKFIALVGNPNSGKTTLFNGLTGTRQKVGNWPGVTVEKKQGKMKGYKDITIIDLPGIYSLSPYSLEEVIARNYIINEKPDLIVNILDGTNLERNLYLSTQIVELGIPMIIAVNMIDLVKKQQDKIKSELIGKYINCKVIDIAALKNEGIKELTDMIVHFDYDAFKYSPVVWFDQKTEAVLSEIYDLINPYFESDLVRWFSVKYFEKDEEVIKLDAIPEPVFDKVKDIVNQYEQSIKEDTETWITQKRYEYVKRINQKVYQKNKIQQEKVTDKIDKIMTNKWLALPLFFIIIFVVYYLSISSIGGIFSGYVNDVIFGENGLPNIVGGWLEAIGTSNWLYSLLIDGILGGVGAVLGFLPQMLVLFLLLGILEETGYMARIAFILDRIFRRFGLSGKSFIPMLISTGCAIPGIMASRTIEDENNRKLTIMTTSFMPCGAKLPIIALFAGALFSNSPVQWLIAPSAYFVGIGAVILSGIILRKFKAFAGEAAPFIMELPDYHLPRVKALGYDVWLKLKSFVKRAGTIILAASVIVWLLSNFTFAFTMTSDAEVSILADIGKFIDVLFRPLGFGDWKAAVATFTGLVAKENVVGTFGVLYGFAEVSESGNEIWTRLAQDFTMLSAYSFVVFNLICAPCFAAIGAIKREMGSKKWTWIAVGYQTGLAYILSLIVYQVGMIFTGHFSFGSVVGLLALGTLIYLLFRKNKYLHIS